MKIHVPSIPEEGKKLKFNQGQEWVQEMVSTQFKDFCLPTANCNGELRLFRTNANVTMTGEVAIATSPRCSRCAQAFTDLLELEFHRHLAPFFDLPDDTRQSDSELEVELELNDDDLNFSTYQNEEIDIAGLLAEEVLLALPMRFLCQEDCQGLCPQCGVNWNAQKCKCLDDKEKSPFSVLKDVKFSQE